MGRHSPYHLPIRYVMDATQQQQHFAWEEPLPIAADVRCGYMGKTCHRPRSLKRDGRLHRFCMYHRERANLNQRRVDARKRLKGHDQEAELAAREYEEVKRREEELERQFESGGCWLNEQELGFLSYLLFHDADDNTQQTDGHGAHPDANQMW